MDNENRELIRKRAKGYRKDEIQVIHAAPIESVYDTNKKLRVAAYCRVSTDNDEQITSYELQKNYYEEYIAKHENWVLVNNYADEGISGTNRAHHEAFNKMIEDVKAGLIDLIIAKSVSRFARNVVDCLTTVRELQSLNPPVRLLFETENIDTGKADSEILLNLLSIFAQEESHTKSEIMTWSIHQRFANGNFITPRLFGYEVDINKLDCYTIVEKEAVVIRLVYAMYVTGYSYKEIANAMAKLKFVSNIKGESKWNANVVRNIIDNERRCGKIIAWKTYTPSYLDHKSKKNNGNRDQFILDDHHDGIVPLEVYEYIMKIKRVRKISHYFGPLPSLSVINDGVLKGFALIDPRYPGFTYDNYLFASDYAHEDKSQVQSPNIRKGDVSNFDLSGYEKADARLFVTRFSPTLTFKGNRIYFNKACMSKLDDADYVEMLFEPEERLIAIRKSNKDQPFAFKWRASDGRGISRSCSGFMLTLCELMKWNDSYQYRLSGTKREKGNELIILFDLDAALPITKKIIDKGDIYDKVSINLLDEYYAYHYGENIYEDAYSMRLYLLDYFKSIHVAATDVPTDESEYSNWARNIINIHLSKLSENV